MKRWAVSIWYGYNKRKYGIKLCQHTYSCSSQDYTYCTVHKYKIQNAQNSDDVLRSNGGGRSLHLILRTILISHGILYLIIRQVHSRCGRATTADSSNWSSFICGLRLVKIPWEFFLCAQLIVRTSGILRDQMSADNQMTDSEPVKSVNNFAAIALEHVALFDVQVNQPKFDTSLHTRSPRALTSSSQNNFEMQQTTFITLPTNLPSSNSKKRSSLSVEDSAEDILESSEFPWFLLFAMQINTSSHANRQILNLFYLLPS